MKEKGEKINHFLLQEQFPSVIKIAGTDKRSSNTGSSKFSPVSTGSSSAALVKSFPSKHSVSTRTVTAVDHVTQLRLESCRCPHFEEYLPRILDLTVCRTTQIQRQLKGWSFANPVHALHMAASQLEAESSLKTQKQRHPPTFLYGEEQHRTTALQAEGIAEYWCSFDGNSPDSSFVPHQNIGLPSSSKLTVKPSSKTLNVGTSFNISTGPSLLKRSASLSEKNGSGSIPKTFCTSNIVNSSTVATEEIMSSKPCRNQGLKLKENNTYTTSAGFNTGSAQQITSTDTSRCILLHDGTTSPLMLRSEHELLAPNQIPQSTLSIVDISKRKITPPEISSGDKVIKEIDKKMISEKLNLNPVPETLPASTSLTFTTNITLEKGYKSSSLNSTGSKIQKALAPTIDVKDHLPKTKMGLVKNEHHMSDSSSSQVLRLSQNAKNTRTTLLDASVSMSISNADAIGSVYSNFNKEKMPIDCVTKEAIKSPHPKTSSTPDLEDVSSGNALSKTNQATEGIKPEPKEFNIGIDQRASEASTTTKEEVTTAIRVKCETANGIKSQAQLKVETIGMEYMMKLGCLNEGEENTSIGSKEKRSYVPFMRNDEVDFDVARAMKSAELKAITEENTNPPIKSGDIRIAISTTCGSEHTIGAAGYCGDAAGAGIGKNSLPTTCRHPIVTRAEIGAVVTESTTSNTSKNMQQNTHLCSQAQFKPDPCIDHFHREEEKIRRARRLLTSKRVRKKPDLSTKEVSRKKRKVSEKSHVIPGWKVPSLSNPNTEDGGNYIDALHTTDETVERWIQNFRLSHESFWVEIERQKRLQNQQNTFKSKHGLVIKNPSCQLCTSKEEEKVVFYKGGSLRKASRPFFGDELMKCLECGFIGCSPRSLNFDTNHDIQQHLLVSGHKFAVSCGEKAQLFCFECGDCVYHEIFEQEKIRIACARKIPYMAWREHAIFRSFDPFQFSKTQDNGILWKGLVATYPPMVPNDHFCAVQLALRRQALFEGNLQENWILPNSNALRFTASQHLKTDQHKFEISAPLGIYNLGNTCFMSSILQCLVFCKPLQQYFLRDSGHHYKSCKMFRHKEDLLTAAAAAPITKISVKSKRPSKVSHIKKASKIDSEVCLACEMDRLFLSYYGGTVGYDIFAPIEESSRNLSLGYIDTPAPFATYVGKGDPLIISDLLTSAWKSEGMHHLTGYDQYDAHEFLDSFLDVLSNHIVRFRNRIHAAVTEVCNEDCFISDRDFRKIDIVRDLFEGSLRSVLLCGHCGVKRIQEEPFMNISLSLSEEVESMHEGNDIPKRDLNLEKCLQHFVLPEILGDLVYCNACGKRTRTKKQHTFAKLPRILCLHLKRFDASKNKKIENFVSFPCYGLNMGVVLSHWCEVTRSDFCTLDDARSTSGAQPRVLYDLFGTVNHMGSMQSGHYVTNVKAGDRWYHCNDQHISFTTEESVLKAEGAYLLFYIRR